jgi:hypothetical protein
MLRLYYYYFYEQRNNHSSKIILRYVEVNDSHLKNKISIAFVTETLVNN